jgi:hypothetical protein
MSVYLSLWFEEQQDGRIGVCNALEVGEVEVMHECICLDGREDADGME